MHFLPSMHSLHFLQSMQFLNSWQFRHCWHSWQSMQFLPSMHSLHFYILRNFWIPGNLGDFFEFFTFSAFFAFLHSSLICFTAFFCILRNFCIRCIFWISSNICILGKNFSREPTSFLRELNWRISGKKRTYLRGRFCCHILKNMAQNHNLWCLEIIKIGARFQ